MLIIVIILSIIAFVKTLGYAIYEYQDNGNKTVGIFLGVFAIVALVRPYYNNFDKVII